MSRTLILGGGIAGLTAAWELKKRDHPFLLIEQSPRVGGWIRTQREEDFLFELGPRGFRPGGKGEATLALVHELGLEKELLTPSLNALKRYVVHKGQLKRLTLPYLLRGGLVGAFFKNLATKRCTQDLSIAEFCRQRLNQKLLDHLVAPIVRGIFGGDPEKLSMQHCLPTFWEWEKRYGSLFWGFLKQPKKQAVPLYSFHEGMETLPRALGRQLASHILLNTPVLSVEKRGATYHVTTSEGILEANHVISTLPNPQCFRLTLTSVHLGWQGRHLSLQGFGFLIPEGEVLGMVWDSEIFPQHDRGERTRVTVMFQGEPPSALQASLELTQKHLKISHAPDYTHLSIARHAIPQYPVGYTHPREDGIHYFGSSYSGVGINDIISYIRNSYTR